MCIHSSSEMVATCLCDMLHYLLSAAYARCGSASTIYVVSFGNALIRSPRVILFFSFPDWEIMIYDVYDCSTGLLWSNLYGR